MTYSATAIEIMLASPGDVKEERVVARKVIAQWNAEHSRDTHVVLMTMGWETHAGSDVSGKRAQALINDRIVTHADLMVGIFWTRLGSPTGKESSGTVEEIKLHHKKRKPLMLYFSDVPIPPSKVDRAQYEEVQSLRSWAFKQGLVSSFARRDEFHELFRRDLALMLKDNDKMRALVMKAGAPSGSQLSATATHLLAMVARAPTTQLVVQERGSSVCYLSGTDILLEATATVDILKWRAALDELLSSDVVRDLTGRNELFELTSKASALISV